MSDQEGRWFGVAEDATRTTIAAAYRAGLIAQRQRLNAISIDVLSDEPWPTEVRWAVDVLEEMLRSKQRRFRRSSATAKTDPRDDAAFEAVVAIAPYAIGGTGIGTRGIIWSGNDSGRSLALRLTPDEEASVRQSVADQGGNPEHLVPIAM